MADTHYSFVTNQSWQQILIQSRYFISKISTKFNMNSSENHNYTLFIVLIDKVVRGAGIAYLELGRGHRLKLENESKQQEDPLENATNDGGCYKDVRV